MQNTNIYVHVVFSKEQKVGVAYFKVKYWFILKGNDFIWFSTLENPYLDTFHACVGVYLVKNKNLSFGHAPFWVLNFDWLPKKLLKDLGLN